MKYIITLLLFISFSCFAQIKASNNDLRTQKEIFIIKSLNTKKQNSYFLNSSASGHFNFITKNDGNILGSQKVDSGDAQKMDDIFVDKFISFKYMMKRKNNNNCKGIFFLSLRGEKLKICSNEVEKIKMIKLMITKIKKIVSI